MCVCEVLLHFVHFGKLAFFLKLLHCGDVVETLKIIENHDEVLVCCKQCPFSHAHINYNTNECTKVQNPHYKDVTLNTHLSIDKNSA